MPCETDLDKAKREFSSLGEVEEYNESNFTEDDTLNIERIKIQTH